MEKDIRGTKDNKDRRRSIRLSLDKPLDIKVKSLPLKVSFESLRKSKALGKNISIGGGLLVELAIESEDEIGRLLSGRKKLLLEINLPGAIPIKAKGKVVWLKKMDKSSSLYRAGVSFDEISEKTRESIIHAMIDLCFKQKCDI